MDENFLRSLLVAPFLLSRALLLIVLVILAAAANILVAAHTHLILVVLVTVHLMVGIIVGRGMSLKYNEIYWGLKYWTGYLSFFSPRHFLPQLF